MTTKDEADDHSKSRLHSSQQIIHTLKACTKQLQSSKMLCQKLRFKSRVKGKWNKARTERSSRTEFPVDQGATINILQCHSFSVTTKLNRPLTISCFLFYFQHITTSLTCSRECRTKLTKILGMQCKRPCTRRMQRTISAKGTALRHAKAVCNDQSRSLGNSN